MPEQERLDDAIGILRNHTEVVVVLIVVLPVEFVFFRLLCFSV